jgi:hypothetical protein
MSFGIYVHWPFCAAKCPYCDFNSHVRTAIDEDGWVDGILSELDWVANNQGASARAGATKKKTIIRWDFCPPRSNIVLMSPNADSCP